jgi:hypothetical protein
VSLCLTKHDAVRLIRGVEVYLHAFLTSAVDGGEWSASRSASFIAEERAHDTHCIGTWVGCTVHLEAVAKRIPESAGNRTPVLELEA